MIFWEGARNILLDNGGQLKVSGFGLIEIVRVFKLTHPMAHIDSKFCFSCEFKFCCA